MVRYFFILLLLVSCKSKRTTTERIVEKDTIQTSSFKYVSQPISTRIVIEDICDTLGNVKRFKQKETSGSNSANVRSENNTLFLDLFTGLSQTKTDTIYKVQYRDRNFETEVIRYRTPFLMWTTLIGSIAINVLLLYILFKK